MTTALVLALAAPALADPREDAQARREALLERARPEVIENGETKENLEQAVVSHYGQPAQGQVLIQTGVEVDWVNFEAVAIQAAAQGVKIRRQGAGFAKRVAVRAEVRSLPDPLGPCVWFSVVHYAVRWDDNTLSSGWVLVALGDWIDPPCLLTPASDLRVR